MGIVGIVDKTPKISVITKIELFSLPNVPAYIVDFARENFSYIIGGNHC